MANEPKSSQSPSLAASWMEPMAMAAAVGEEVGVAVGVMVTVMLSGWGWSTAGREATSRLSGGLTLMLGRPGATSGIRVVGTATSRAARRTANGAAGGSRSGADSIYARRWIIGSEVVQSSIFGVGRRSSVEARRKSRNRCFRGRRVVTVEDDAPGFSGEMGVSSTIGAD